MIAHTVNMCAPCILCTLDNIFGIVELRHYYVYTTFGVLTLFICVICNSNRFHSFIFKLCIVIVHTLKMCTGDAGPEQSLVLCFFSKLGKDAPKFHWELGRISATENTKNLAPENTKMNPCTYTISLMNCPKYVSGFSTCRQRFNTRSYILSTSRNIARRCY